MKWIAGVSLIAVIVGAAATITTPAATVSLDRNILKLFPAETQGVAFVDVASLRNAALVQKLLDAYRPGLEKGEMGEFIQATGFVPERDLDRVTVGRLAGKDVLVIVEARYDRLKVEQFLREKNAASESYQGWAIYKDPHGRDNDDDRGGVALLDNLVIAGDLKAIHGAIERRAAPSTSVLDNAGVMDVINTIEAGNQIWAAGRFTLNDFPFPRRQLGPAQDLLKSLEGGTYQMLIDDDVHVRAKGDFGTADDARNLTDMIRGLISIAKLQAAREPSLVKLLETIRVDASGQSMIVSVDAPGDLIPIVR